jgi:hypothetical protein
MRGLFVREPRDREHQIVALGIAAHQRQRRLRRLALAVEVILMHGVEVAECDSKPGRRCRSEQHVRTLC